MQVTLLVRAPKKPEKRVLVESDVVIGRGKDCNLQVLSNDVSRQHCRLVIGESGVAIRDLGSGNGTFLNGQKTKPNTNASLITGDIVRIGPLVIKVEFPATSPQPATVPVNSPTDEAAITADADAIAEQFLEPADEELIAGGFAVADPEEIAETEPVVKELSAVEQPAEKSEKKKSLFGMFGRKKNKSEPAAAESDSDEPELAGNPGSTGQELLLVAENSDFDQETVVFERENAFMPEELSMDDEVLADDGNFLDEDEEESVDPGFADFLNNVDPSPQ
jgi:predicted component of type VI protein secretion system